MPFGVPIYVPELHCYFEANDESFEDFNTRELSGPYHVARSGTSAVERTAALRWRGPQLETLDERFQAHAGICRSGIPTANHGYRRLLRLRRAQSHRPRRDTEASNEFAPSHGVSLRACFA